MSAPFRSGPNVLEMEYSSFSFSASSVSEYMTLVNVLKVFLIYMLSINIFLERCLF